MIDCTPATRRLGVRRGQPLATAHKLAPEAVFLPADLDSYGNAFEAALEAMTAFTPALEGDPDPLGERFGEAYLGIEGLERLWGDEEHLLGRIVAVLAPILPGPPRAGIGGTRFGARVAGLVGDRLLPLVESGAGGNRAYGRESGASGLESAPEGRWGVIPPGDASTEAAYLAPLSITLLPADAVLQDRFRLFGLRTMGDFARLDRAAAVARFGSTGSELLDLARGLDGRGIVPCRPLERLRADAELDPPAEHLESLRFVLHHLAGVLCAQLAVRGAGASRAELVLDLEAAEPLHLGQALPEPVAAADLLERLLFARLESTPPEAPVTRLCLELHGRAPAAGRQLGLFTPQEARAGRLDWQLTGLALRFGADRVLAARLSDPEAMLAEDRFEWRPIGAWSFGEWPREGSPGESGRGESPRGQWSRGEWSA